MKWIKGYQDKHSNPVFKHCKNPDKWEIKDSRFIMFRYGKGGSIDIKIRENNSDFRNLLINDSDVKKYLSKKNIENLFDISNHTKNIKYIFDRVFKN